MVTGTVITVFVKILTVEAFLPTYIAHYFRHFLDMRKRLQANSTLLSALCNGHSALKTAQSFTFPAGVRKAFEAQLDFA